MEGGSSCVPAVVGAWLLQASGTSELVLHLAFHQHNVPWLWKTRAGSWSQGGEAGCPAPVPFAAAGTRTLQFPRGQLTVLRCYPTRDLGCHMGTCWWMVKWPVPSALSQGGLDLCFLLPQLRSRQSSVRRCSWSSNHSCG